MPIKLIWLGHGGWRIQTDQHQILLDPFLTDCPTATETADAISADFILLSHGHFDHVADVPAIAKRTGCQVIANFEVSTWLSNQGVENVLGMNHGGTTTAAFGTVKMTQAIHSSSLPDGSYGGNPGGFIVGIEGKKIYFACDTALFSDMKLIGNEGIDLAVLPIGDLYTMGIEDSVLATEFIQPTKVLPAHYNTWPPIEQDATAWASRIKSETDAEPVVLAVGESLSL
jgi:L-ascorbate metabolism protein UlaG (beta-lactamase superfamily)